MPERYTPTPEDRTPKNGESTIDAFDLLNIQATKEAHDRRWAELDDETRTGFNEARATFERIGTNIKSRQDQRNVVLQSLSDQAREAHQELKAAHQMYIDGVGTPKAFDVDVRNALHQFQAVEQRLSSEQ